MSESVPTGMKNSRPWSHVSARDWRRWTFPLPRCRTTRQRESRFATATPLHLHLWRARLPLALYRAILPNPCDAYCPVAFIQAAQISVHPCGFRLSPVYS